MPALSKKRIVSLPVASLRRSAWLFLILLGSVFSLNAQKQSSIWYFGRNAGLDFSNFDPVTLVNGQTSNIGGVASICDQNGQLLFYSDGQSIWDASHARVPNNLSGDPRSTQAATIVPDPDVVGQYFVFTTRNFTQGSENNWAGNFYTLEKVDGGTWKVRYDFSLDKGIPGLLKNATEKFLAIPYKNARGKTAYWFLMHEFNTNRFLKVRLDDGWSDPQFQSIGSVHANGEGENGENLGAQGQMKVNDQGNRVALAVTGGKFFEIFTFSTSDGMLSRPLMIPAGYQGNLNAFNYGAYGVEFSPTGSYAFGESTSGNFLYGSTRDGAYVYQWNLAETDNLQLVKSGKVLFNNPGFEGGSLQIAPNGKIYVAFRGQDYLGVINHPMRPKPYCTFAEYGVSLIDNENGTGGLSELGLPATVPVIKNREGFNIENLCFGDISTFVIINQTNIIQSSITFNVVKKGGGSVPKPKKPDVGTYEIQYKFPSPGKYDVILQLLRQGGGPPEVYTNPVTVNTPPDVFLDARDIVPLCEGDSIYLDAGAHAFYMWEDPEKRMRTRWVKTDINSPYDYPVEYRVMITDNNGCVGWDTVSIAKKRPPSFTKTIIQPFCELKDGVIIIDPNGKLEDYSFRWKDFQNNTTNKLEQIGAGDYEVTVTSLISLCEKIDMIKVTPRGMDDARIVPSILGPVCPNTLITLSVKGEGEVVWEHNGSTLKDITVSPDQTTTYTAYYSYRIDNRDPCPMPLKYTIEVHRVTPPVLQLVPPSCDGSIVKIPGGLDLGGVEYRSYSWYDNLERLIGQDKEAQISASTLGLYVKVIEQHGCETRSNSIDITFNPIPVLDLGDYNRKECAKEILLEPLPGMGDDADYYEWNPGAIQSKQYKATKSGTYTLLIKKKGCPNSKSVLVHLNDPDLFKVSVKPENIKDITCFGAGNGSVRIDATSEDGSQFVYSIDGPVIQSNTTGVFTELLPGVYNIRVNEDQNCTQILNPPLRALLEPPPVGLNFCVQHPKQANSSDGGINVEGTGGSGGYQIYMNGNLVSNPNISNLPSGNYQFMVSDRNGCRPPDNTPYTVTLVDGKGLRIVPSKTGPICPREEITLEVMNAEGGMIHWDEIPDETRNKITVAPSQTIIYHVTSSKTMGDGTPCFDTDEITVSVMPDFKIEIQLPIDNSCYVNDLNPASGSLMIKIDPPGEYSYSLDNNIFYASSVFRSLEPNTYFVTVKDANQCKKALDTGILIGQPDPIVVDLGIKSPTGSGLSDGRMIIRDIAGGTPGYEIFLNGDKFDKTIDGLASGIKYGLEIKDKNGCIWRMDTTLTVSKPIYNVLTPGTDGKNDYWYISLLDGVTDCSVLVYDLNGKLVYKVENGSYDPWNGKFMNTGYECPEGTYFYWIDLGLLFDEAERIRKGTLMIIRKR